MKVLIAIEKFNRGGLETVILDVLNNFNRLNLDVEFELLLNYKDGELIPYLNSNIKTHIIPRKKIFDLQSLYTKRQFLKNEKYDLIHTHSPVIGMFLFWAKIGLKIPMIQSVHGFLDKRSSSGKASFIHLLMTLFLSIFIQKTIYVSNYLMKEFLKIGFPRIKAIALPNGIDLKKIKVNSNTKLDSIENFKSIKFGMVGNFNSGRSHTVLLQSFKTLLGFNNELMLYLAGDGELKNDLIEMAHQLEIEKYVKFLGKISDVALFLRSIDCFVYSSRSDTFGVAVVEALAFGIPVIVSDNGALPEITENGKIATLFKCGDAEDLYKKMKLFLDFPEQFIIKTKMAQNKIEEKYSIERHIKLLIRLYSEILIK